MWKLTEAKRSEKNKLDGFLTLADQEEQSNRQGEAGRSGRASFILNLGFCLVPAGNAPAYSVLQI